MDLQKINVQKSERKENLDNLIKQLAYPLIAIITSFVVGGLLVAAFGSNPIVAYSAMLRGSLGDITSIGETLVITTYLILTGLSIAFGFRCGLFNIGAEGQFVMGAITAVWIGWGLKGLPPFLHVTLTLVGGALAGGFWGGFVGWLKARLGSHEVINGIMMNYIAVQLSNFWVRTSLNQDGKAFSVEIADSAKLWRFSETFSVFSKTRLSGGLFVAILVALVAYYVLNKTQKGFEIRAVGFNQHAAEYGGINVKNNIILAMFSAGLFAGLAGAIMTSAMQYRVNQLMGFTGFGMDGIAVALVGNNHPIGVIISALLFGILQKGGPMMQIEGIAKEVVFIVQGILILFVAANFVRIMHDKYKINKELKNSLNKREGK